MIVELNLFIRLIMWVLYNGNNKFDETKLLIETDGNVFENPNYIDTLLPIITKSDVENDDSDQKNLYWLGRIR